ncbi:MAG: hypothetical protein K9M08_08790 [Pirellula sp.]|nr:hypothetical protein [Pirellula sp.]
MTSSTRTHPKKMTRKKTTKRSDLAPPPKRTPEESQVEPGRQPRTLGWFVLIVGACSTWYWYRPLPKSVTETVHSTIPNNWPTSQSGPRNLWTDDGLIAPSIDDIKFHNAVDRLNPSAPNSDNSPLVGTPNVSVIPWEDTRKDFRDVLRAEVLPRLPVEPLVTSVPIDSKPPTWTTNDQSSLPPKASKEASKDREAKWPDAGYVPEQVVQKAKQKQANKITTKIPPLLETGMRSIRTSEEIETAGQGDVSNPARLESNPQEPAVPRQPNFIRQPTKK